MIEFNARPYTVKSKTASRHVNIKKNSQSLFRDKVRAREVRSTWIQRRRGKRIKRNAKPQQRNGENTNEKLMKLPVRLREHRKLIV